MNTTQLECFVRVAETLSYQQAADDLHISQPAVSKQIMALENELDAALFIRTTRTVALTPIGEKFLADAKRLLQITYHARQLSASARGKEEQVLRIGYTDGSELFFMTPAFQKLKEKYPDFVPLLACNKWDVNTLAVEHGQLDTCFSFRKSNRNSHLVFQQLSGGRFVCLMPPGHPLAESGFIRTEDIRNEQLIWIVPMPLRNTFYNNKDLQSFIDSSEKKPILCETIAEAFLLVNAGFGCCAVPEYLAFPPPGLRFVPCDFHTDLVHGVYYHDENKSALLKAFLEEIHTNRQAD